MTCEKCQKELPLDAKFCVNCGTVVTLADHKPSREHEEIWAKFQEIYTSEGDLRTYYEEYTCRATRKFIERLGDNHFYRFYEVNQQHFSDKGLKETLFLQEIFENAAFGGYLFFMAEAFVKNKKVNKVHHVDIDKLREDWQVAIGKYFETGLKDIPNAIMQALVRWSDGLLGDVGKPDTTLGKMENHAREELKFMVLRLAIWTYLLGIVEAQYRASS